MTNMKLGSLFDGSGGFPLAGTIHGITPVWASEIEAYPIKVTKARFPQMKHLGSVLDVNGAEVEPVDIITFGSPCQDLSVAGKQAGLHKGERSNLFFEAIRIIKEMREATNGKYPRIAVWENVPGAYSSNKGEDFRAVLEAFCNIADDTVSIPEPPKGKWLNAGQVVGEGYSVAWRTFDAQYWGVPQRRKRIYLIADFGSERAGEILFEQEGVRGDTAESGKAGESAAGDAQGGAGRGCAYGLTTKGNGDAFIAEERHMALSCGGGQAGQGYPAIIYSATQQGGTAMEGTPADAEGSAGRGGVCYAYDQYNGAISKKQATLGVNCGMSTGRNGVCYAVRTAQPNANGIGVAQDAHTLDGANAQAVCYPINTMVATRHKADDGRTTFGIGENGDPQFTLGAAHEHAVCYAIDSLSSNSMKSPNPNSGFHEEVIAKCLDTSGGNPSCNQGGNVIVQQPRYAVDLIRESRGAFEAYEEDADKAGALKQCDSKGSQVVCYQNKVGALCMDDYKGINQQYVSQDKVVVYAMGTGGNNGPMVMTYRKTTHPRNADEAQGWEPTDKADTLNVFDNSESRTPTAVVESYPAITCGNGQAHMASHISIEKAGPLDCMHDAQIVLHKAKPPRKYIIRRLTPLECCRLQGFPDWWEDGVQGSDSARYKMWGNGIALPNAEYVVRQAKRLLIGGM